MRRGALPGFNTANSATATPRRWMLSAGMPQPAPPGRAGGGHGGPGSEWHASPCAPHHARASVRTCSQPVSHLVRVLNARPNLALRKPLRHRRAAGSGMTKFRPRDRSPAGNGIIGPATVALAAVALTECATASGEPSRRDPSSSSARSRRASIVFGSRNHLPLLPDHLHRLGTNPVRLGAHLGPGRVVHGPGRRIR